MEKRSNKKSVIILLSFFGRIPWYFKFFIESCRNNPTIIFCLITDNKINSINFPTNVFSHYISKNQFQKIASESLGFKTSKITGYKICDYRPSFAYIFPDIIKGFDFWGYGDIDIIYGNVRRFLTDKILDCFDIFSFRPEYLTGSFTVLRNINKINSLFSESIDYKFILSKNKYLNFDECNFLHAHLQTGVSIHEIPSRIESFTHLVKRKEAEGYLRAYFDFNLLEGSVGNIKWEKGKIIYKDQFEAILYHLLKFKDICIVEENILPLSKHEIILFTEKRIYKKIK